MVKRIRSDIIRPTMFIGIDPGVSGAIAIIDRDQNVLLLGILNGYFPDIFPLSIIWDFNVICNVLKVC